jgi:AraC-like DNA-binding protein
MILFDQAGAGEYRSKIAPPDPGLKGFVEHFWEEHAPAAKACQAPWRIVPDVNPYIIVVVSRGPKILENIRCAVVGARSRFVDVSVVNRALTLGARLRPGALPLLTQLPASDFADRSVPVEEIFGVRGKLLIDRLADRRSAAQALRVLAEFLGREFSNQNPCDEADALESQKGRVEDLASLLGLPKRTLHERMKEHMGLAPKRLLRIQRLHRALSICRKHPMSWAQVSAACGFADQAHLVREFRDLLGERPSSWRERAVPADLSKTNRRIKH